MGFTALSAQVSPNGDYGLRYDLNDYKARFDRRPGLSINPRLSAFGVFDPDELARHSQNVDIVSRGFLFSNTDRKIDNRAFSNRLFAGSETNEDINGRYNIAVVQVNLSREVLHYNRPNNKFWGWSLLSNVYGGYTGIQNEFNNTSGSLSLNPSVFWGAGRIEFAEDALLARWMLQDLVAADVVSDYQSQDVERLARTITDIIGNRTFDFRRRRIYELRRLKDAVMESGLVQEESFDLFAVLNDNWAFALREPLTHGSRFQYGLANRTGWNRAFSSWFGGQSQLPLSVGGFAEYLISRINARQNGGHEWTFRLSSDYRVVFIDSGDTEWANVREEQSTTLRVGYVYKWLPNSRTEWSWSTNASGSVNLPWNTNANALLSSNQYQGNLSTRLNLNQFISYRWRIRASGGLWVQHQFYQDLEAFNSTRFNPSFSISSEYFFF